MAVAYRVIVLDAMGNPVASFPSTVKYRKKKNQGTDFSFVAPPDEDILQTLLPERRCTVYNEDKPLISGVIRNRDLTVSSPNIFCITNHVKLNNYRTPEAWTGWNGMDLKDAVEDMLYSFLVQRQNLQSQWTSAVDMDKVDVVTMPGKVILAKDANGSYYSSGHITLQFDFGQDLQRYQLLRWSETVGDMVRIRAEFRPSFDAVSWSPWSERLASVFPDTYGVALTGSGRYIQVRMRLYTNDTMSIDKNGNPTGVTPILSGVEVVGRGKTIFTKGSFPAIATGKVLNGYQFNRDNYLNIIKTWCDDFGYEFDVGHNLELHFGAELGKETDFILRATDNINIKNLSDESKDLVNYLTCYGAGDGPAQIMTARRDDNSINNYGLKPGEFEDKDADSIEKLNTSADKYLATKAWPKEEFIVSMPVSLLNEDGSLGCLDTVRVVDPTRGFETKAKILDEDSDGAIITFGLNTDLDNILEKLSKGNIARPKSRGLPPEPPTDVRIKSGYKHILISWQSDADRFAIEHSLDGQDFSLLQVVTTKEYVHSQLDIDSTHFYRVVAIKNDLVSVPSVTVTAIVRNIPTTDIDDFDIDKTPPGKPLNLSMQQQVANRIGDAFDIVIMLTWTNDSAADLALTEIQRAVDNGTWEVIGTSKGSSFIDRDIVIGSKYAYRLVHEDYSGNRSEFSDEASITTTNIIPPPLAPANINIAKGASFFKVEWNKSKTTDGNDDLNIKEYEVFVSDTSGFTPSDNNKVYAGFATTAFVRADGDKTYYVRVRARNKMNDTSPFTDEVSFYLPKIAKEELAFAALTVDDLTAYKFSADQIYGGNLDISRFITINNGNGKVVWDTTGFYAIQNGVKTFSIDPEDGSAFYGGPLSAKQITVDQLDVNRLNLNGWVSVLLRTTGYPLLSTSGKDYRSNNGDSWQTVYETTLPRSSDAYYIARIAYKINFRRLSWISTGATMARLQVVIGGQVFTGAAHQQVSQTNNWGEVRGELDCDGPQSSQATIKLQLYGPAGSITAFTLNTNEVAQNRKI